MTIKKYQTQIEIDITPEFHAKFPEVLYGINYPTRKQILTGPTTLVFDEELPIGEHKFVLDFYNKTSADCVPKQNLDMKLTINDVRFGGISLPRFLWMSEYIPVYPEPWFSQQDTKPESSLVGATILGHNGRWQIKFSSPIFPWIHKEEQMGWIWPID